MFCNVRRIVTRFILISQQNSEYTFAALRCDLGL